jgi:hypothetical protein
MRRVTETHSRLVIAERPWFLATLSVAMSLGMVARGLEGWSRFGTLERAVLPLGVLMTAVLAWIVAGSVSLTFDQAEGTVRWARRFGLALRSRHGVYPLADLVRATVEAREFDDGRSYRATLELRDGAFPITEAYGPEHRAKELVDSINAWLRQNSLLDDGRTSEPVLPQPRSEKAP